MEAQLAFRESTTRIRDFSVTMVAGFVSAPAGMLAGEHIAEFVVYPAWSDAGAAKGMGMGTLSLGLMPLPGSLRAPDIDDGFAGDGMGSFVTKPIWRSPEGNGTLELFCRETRMPPRLEGETVFAVEGLASTPAAMRLDTDSIWVFRRNEGSTGLTGVGRLGAEVNPDWQIPPMVEATRGRQLSQFYGMPLWGWGTEPVGIPATMHLHMCDLLDRWNRLDEAGREADPELTRQMRVWGLDASLRDEQFGRVLDHIRESHPEYFENRSCSQPRTAAEERAANAIMREAISAVLSEDAPRP